MIIPPDTAVTQKTCAFAFNALLDELVAMKKSFWARLSQKKPKGIYLYGPVGAGKTYLMDSFLRDIPPSITPYRTHFHEFIRDIDLELRALQGKKNPLNLIVRRLLKDIDLLCLDECLIHDLTCSIIFTQLFTVLAKKGMIFIITSNTPPDHLYWNGVHREQFLPTIDAIKTICQVIYLNEGIDHRRQYAKNIEAFSPPPRKEGVIEIQHRYIPYVACTDSLIWFEFDTICAMPRSTLDYIELAERFKIILISHLRPIAPEDTTKALLLTHLVDVLYDHHVELISLSNAPIETLYPHGPLRESFKRTESRLLEMQSFHYQHKS